MKIYLSEIKIITIMQARNKRKAIKELRNIYGKGAKIKIETGSALTPRRADRERGKLCIE